LEEGEIERIGSFQLKKTANKICEPNELPPVCEVSSLNDDVILDHRFGLRDLHDVVAAADVNSQKRSKKF